MHARYFREQPSKEARRTFGMWTRQLHRWLAILFTTTVAANFIADALGMRPAWIVYSPLAPLFLLMFSGLYMFALPHVQRRSVR